MDEEQVWLLIAALAVLAGETQSVAVQRADSIADAWAERYSDEE